MGGSVDPVPAFEAEAALDYDLDTESGILLSSFMDGELTITNFIHNGACLKRVQNYSAFQTSASQASTISQCSFCEVKRIFLFPYCFSPLYYSWDCLIVNVYRDHISLYKWICRNNPYRFLLYNDFWDHILPYNWIYHNNP